MTRHSSQLHGARYTSQKSLSPNAWTSQFPFVHYTTAQKGLPPQSTSPVFLPEDQSDLSMLVRHDRMGTGWTLKDLATPLRTITVDTCSHALPTLSESTIPNVSIQVDTAKNDAAIRVLSTQTSPLFNQVSTASRPVIKKWTQGQLIGQGAFGKVFHGLNLDTGEIMAVKQVLIGPANDTQKKRREDALRREMELLEEMDHVHIVRYLGYEITDSAFNVFLEYVPGGSIASMLSKYGKFEDGLAKSMTAQILLGLKYLHGRSIIHRDIKGANMDLNGCAKISDFGTSKKHEYQAAYKRATRMSMQGSIYWMAPEVAKGRGYSAKVDIWSLGCLVLEMLTGNQPWFGVKGNIMLFLGSGQVPPIPTEDVSEDARDFLFQCFTANPDDRPTASQLLSHPFVTKKDVSFDFSTWLKAAMEKRALYLAEMEAYQESSDEDSDYGSENESFEIIEVDGEEIEG